MYNLIFYGALDPTIYFVVDSKKVAYLPLAKVACSSIMNAMLARGVASWWNKREEVHWLASYKRHSIATNYFVFTFVRNPFDRILSCYKDKYGQHTQRTWKFHFSWYLFWYLQERDSFEDFVRKICKIPDFLAERHFKSQYSSLHKFWCFLPQSVWKFETLENDFEEIRKTYDFCLLPHYNSTPKDNYMDWYTPALVDLVYEKYKNDVTYFGYENEYLSLKEHVAHK